MAPNCTLPSRLFLAMAGCCRNRRRNEKSSNALIVRIALCVAGGQTSNEGVLTSIIASGPALLFGSRPLLFIGLSRSRSIAVPRYIVV